MKKINWGIIGCGDVTEIKSGPAFSKVPDSGLVAVMRRDEEKVKDYAKRHDVPKWYTNAYDLINDDTINAIYIATPPSLHEEYTVAALHSGKPVYVEKPMAAKASAAINMMKAAKQAKVKLSVAHYRREQPLFKKVKQLLEEKAIGEVRFIQLDLYKKGVTREELDDPRVAWRVNAPVSGGGLFHDLAPHQLDLMYYFFGDPQRINGISLNQAGLYNADDIVSGNILFHSGILFNGTWCFSVNDAEEKDSCEIFGSKGKISFSVFEHQKLSVTKNGFEEIIPFEKLQHVQQPMIQKVTEYFLGKAANPCPAEDGVKVMEMIEQFTKV